QPESTRRIVAPTTRIGPRRDSRNQQNQHDQEQYHAQSDGLRLENITAVEYYSAAQIVCRRIRCSTPVSTPTAAAATTSAPEFLQIRPKMFRSMGGVSAHLPQV